MITKLNRSFPGPHQAPPSAKKPDEGSFWKERADELREILLFVDQEKLEDAGRIVKSIGGGLKGAWRQIKEVPAKIFDLEIISDKIDEDKQEQLVQWGEMLGKTAGFIASGGHAIGGVLKIASGHQQRDTSKKLDGIMDMATATTLAVTVAGLGAARAILAPLTASFNIFRGGYNAAHGFKTNDGRKQLQGALDSVRSAGSVGRMLKNHASVFKVGGIALAPIAGGIQAGRGLHDLSIGLRNGNNKKELKGLVDIATAVGTGLAFASGVAIIPGIALAVAANIVKIAYEISPKARKKIDPVLDRAEPKLQKIVDGAEKVSEPIRETWKKVIGRFVKEKETDGPEKFSKAQLAEIANLLTSDGEYTRQEERRLKIKLEKAGQVEELPSRKDAPPKTDRQALSQELASKDDKIEFMKYLVVAAHYDQIEVEGEEKYLNELAGVLGLSPEEMKTIRDEHPVTLSEDPQLR